MYLKDANLLHHSKQHEHFISAGGGGGVGMGFGENVEGKEHVMD